MKRRNQESSHKEGNIDKDFKILVSEIFDSLRSARLRKGILDLKPDEQRDIKLGIGLISWCRVH